ncbi:MAG: hypothetical protein DRR42_20505 [Gammaproteobacteria bacterium]|nr:MAG: hypothetical protein DRR42_20505 [Gammaproteobacteria bacterium]
MNPIMDEIERAELPQESDEQATFRLASLTELDYDRQREAEAKKMGVRVATLDKQVMAARNDSSLNSAADELIEGIEAWPQPVSADELLNEGRAAFNRYCVLPEGADIALALWVLGTYCIDAFRIFPKACLSSPEKRCGKTTTLEILDALVNRSILASNISPSVIFRAVEAWHPSLLIDEADTFIGANEEMRGIINSGHTRASAFVLRTEGEGADRQPKRFSTWTPMAIAMIKTPPDTIIDRSIMVTLRRKMPGESVEKLLLGFKDNYQTFRRKCRRWSEDNFSELTHCKPDIPNVSSDRAQDNWSPMLAIAELAGGAWPDLARAAMLKIEGGKGGDESIGPELLMDIRAIFEDKGKQKLYSDDLVNVLIDLEERPWCEWRRGNPLTKNSLSKLLKPFGIRSKQVRADTQNKRGYELAQFEDAFARYLPETPVQSATTLQPSSHADFSQFQNATEGSNVALDKQLKPGTSKACSVAALQTGGLKEDAADQGILL